jgi:hypothetical protein
MNHQLLQIKTEIASIGSVILRKRKTDIPITSEAPRTSLTTQLAALACRRRQNLARSRGYKLMCATRKPWLLTRKRTQRANQSKDESEGDVYLARLTASARRCRWLFSRLSGVVSWGFRVAREEVKLMDSWG